MIFLYAYKPNKEKMKITKTKVNKTTLIRWKVYFDRSRMYIGYIQFFLIGIVFIQSFKDKNWGDLFFKYAIITIPVFVILFISISLLLGYLDSKMGFRAEELRNLSRSNPVLMEILGSVKEIRKDLEEIKEGK